MKHKFLNEVARRYESKIFLTANAKLNKWGLNRDFTTAQDVTQDALVYFLSKDAKTLDNVVHARNSLFNALNIMIKRLMNKSKEFNGDVEDAVAEMQDNTRDLQAKVLADAIEKLSVKKPKQAEALKRKLKGIKQPDKTSQKHAERGLAKVKQMLLDPITKAPKLSFEEKLHTGLHTKSSVAYKV